MNPQLLAVILAQLPSAIGVVRAAFKREHPDAPLPTSTEVIAAYQEALTSSLATDAAWLASHPPEP